MAFEDKAYTVFTFASTHHALKAESLLKAKALKGFIIPVPPGISSVCGLAIRVDTGLRGQVEKVLRNNGVEPEIILDF